MISTSHKFIYLHVPKTGGNTIQTVLLPVSDDKKQSTSSQDGVNRFDIKGPITPEKHASLQEYFEIIGSALAAYRIVISVRHPFERAVSGYFSPHKWLQRNAAGEWVRLDPYWDEARFWDLLKMRNHMAATDYLRVNGEIRPPDLVIRKESLAVNLSHCISTLCLPIKASGPGPHVAVPHVNASAARPGLIRQVLESREVRDMVEQKYRADMDFFQYHAYSVAKN